MKNCVKLIAIILLLAMAAASIACAKAGTENITPMPMNPVASPESDVAGVIIHGDPEEVEYVFHRVEYHSGDDQKKIEPTVISNSREFAELVLPNLPEADRRAAEEKYNDAFFEKYHLVMFFVTYGSGSVKPTVKSAEYADGKVVITVEGVMEGEVGTCDMATHIGIVVLANDRYPLDSEVVVEGVKVNNSSASRE